MLGASLCIAAKDMRLALRGPAGLARVVLLGLLLLFVLSLSRHPGEAVPAVTAAALFWLASAFCVVLVFGGLYEAEERSGGKIGLLLAPMPIQAVWLGKTLAGLGLLLLSQLVFFPAMAVFLDQSLAGDPLWAVCGLAAVDLGLSVLAGLMAAAVGSGAARESLSTVILFPLFAPLLLAGISLLEAGLGPVPESPARWMTLALAFDAVYVAASLLLFPFIFGQED